MSNTIYRDSVINELERAKVRVSHSVERAIGRGIIEILDDVEKNIKALPIVETQVVRCKDCKWFLSIGCAIEIVDDSDKPTEDDFCSFAERKEVAE